MDTFITFTAQQAHPEEAKREVAIRANSIQAVEDWGDKGCLIWVAGLHDQIVVLGSREAIVKRITS